MPALERLLNLIGLLISARIPQSFEDIRRKMPGAYDQADVNSAKRMFERDKDQLRDFGVPVETRLIDPLDGGNVGYLIDRRTAYLPTIDFTRDEQVALWAVASVAGHGDPEGRAIRKLLVAAQEPERAPDAVTVPVVVATEPAGAIVPIADLLASRRAIAFDYRAGSGDVTRREVDTHGLVYANGHWYVVGHDRARGERRVFRISRIAGAVEDIGAAAPASDGQAPGDALRTGPWDDGPTSTTVVIAFSPEVADYARTQIPGATERTDADGWTVLEASSSDLSWAASWVLSFGDDAVAVEPADLRAEIVRRLEAAGGAA